MEKIKTIEELLKIAKQLKADYACIDADNEEYKKFIFSWITKNDRKNNKLRGV